jgi:magnesium transporter
VLLDSLIDQYLVALEKIGQTIEDLDRRVIKKHTEVHLNKLHHLKKELLLFRKITTPVPELLLHIRSKEFEKDSGHATVPYWQDLYDHALQVSELVKTYSDILNGIFDLYFSLVSTKTNQIVQALTVITIVFMPLTLLAGIYGMNFKYMPELQWKWGYPGVIAFMISIGVFLLLLFRKKKWF